MCSILNEMMKSIDPKPPEDELPYRLVDQLEETISKFPGVEDVDTDRHITSPRVSMLVSSARIMHELLNVFYRDPYIWECEIQSRFFDMKPNPRKYVSLTAWFIDANKKSPNELKKDLLKTNKLLKYALLRIRNPPNK